MAASSVSSSLQDGFSPGGFMISAATAVVTWLITGVVGYSDWAARPGTDALAMLAVVIAFLQFGSLSVLVSIAGVGWPSRISAYATSSIVCCGASTMYALRFRDKWAHYFQFLFWSLSGIYLGVVVEAAVGVFGQVEGAIAATAAHGE